MMNGNKIVVVVDSSAYIPESALEGLDIVVIPLWLIWDEQNYRDSVDIDPPTFYARLKQSKTLPTTSQPSPGEFVELYKELATDRDGIVSVLASSKISGTVDSAVQAKAELPELDVRIVDSFASSMGLGFVALAAARAAAADKSIDEVVAAAEDMREKVGLMFAVGTLEFLHRTGRISGAKRLMGTALSIKPLLHFHDGKIVPLSQARTKRKACIELLNCVETRLGGKQMAEAAVIDIDCPEDGEDLVRQVKERFNPPVIHRATVSPVVSAIVGPGATGVAFYPED
jgi:DegV family protein with EDD domain